MRGLVASALVLGALSMPAMADDKPVAKSLELIVDGAVANPQHLSLADLKALPAVTVEVSYITGHGTEHGVFTGALLWTVMEKAGLANAKGQHPDLEHPLIASATDGYKIAFAFGEIDPELEGKQIIVAYARDGKSLEDSEGLRLVVPGDKHGARDVRGLVRIEVR